MGFSEKQSAKNTDTHSHVYRQGREPEDWWDEIKRTHGHVGPWNVLGWRIGKAALRELDTK